MNKENLIKLLFDNSTFKIEQQYLDVGDPHDIREELQVAVWCETFGEAWSLCFQATDMNGEGGPTYQNPGADSYKDELWDILNNRKEFDHLSADDQEELIDDFIRQYAESNNIYDLFDKYDAEKEQN